MTPALSAAQALLEAECPHKAAYSDSLGHVYRTWARECLDCVEAALAAYGGDKTGCPECDAIGNWCPTCWAKGEDLPAPQPDPLPRAILPDLLREARHALAFLEDLEASGNSCTDPADPQATGFHLAVNGLRQAINAAALPRAILAYIGEPPEPEEPQRCEMAPRETWGHPEYPRCSSMTPDLAHVCYLYEQHFKGMHCCGCGARWFPGQPVHEVGAEAGPAHAPHCLAHLAGKCSCKP